MRDPLLAPVLTVAKPSAILPLAVGLQDAARLVGLSDTGLENLIRRGEGPKFSRLGNRRLFRVKALEQWLAEREGQP